MPFLPYMWATISFWPLPCSHFHTWIYYCMPWHTGQEIPSATQGLKLGRGKVRTGWKNNVDKTFSTDIPSAFSLFFGFPLLHQLPVHGSLSQERLSEQFKCQTLQVSAFPFRELTNWMNCTHEVVWAIWISKSKEFLNRRMESIPFNLSQEKWCPDTSGVKTCNKRPAFTALFWQVCFPQQW